MRDLQKLRGSAPMKSGYQYGQRYRLVNAGCFGNLVRMKMRDAQPAFIDLQLTYSAELDLFFNT